MNNSYKVNVVSERREGKMQHFGVEHLLRERRKLTFLAVKLSLLISPPSLVKPSVTE